MAGPNDEENKNEGNDLDGATGERQTVNRNHKEPKISDILPDSPVFKFSQYLAAVIKTQATRKSNITKLSNMIKVTILETEDYCYQGCDPEGSSITDAQGEVTDLKTKLRDSWTIYNNLNLRSLSSSHS